MITTHAHARTHTHTLKIHMSCNMCKTDKLPKGEVFNDFPVFGATYTTFRSGYTPLEFDRLRELMKFNVKSNVQDIKCEIGKKILQRRCSQSKD